MKTADLPIRLAPLILLFAIALIAGQSGIPTEDGGEIITVARLGGTCHPPGMPLLALFSRLSWVISGQHGLRILFALFAGASLWLLSRRTGLPGLVLACGVLLLPAVRTRLLAWDAYSLLFLVYTAGMAAGRISCTAAGYLTGIALAVHPLGLFLPVVLRVRRLSLLEALSGAILGASLYLALPIGSAAGAVVDWGACGSLQNFLRQITAGGYREVYGESMGRFSVGTVLSHLSVLREILWPVLVLPVLLGVVRLWREGRKSLLCRIAMLLAADVLFVWTVNPMAAGTSQTGILSLLALLVLAFAGLYAIEGRRLVGWVLASAVVAVGIISPAPLEDQEQDVYYFFSPTPLNSGFFISNNDLLYGGWVMKYARDLRPDIVLLYTANFSGWFEEMAVHFNPDIDLSRCAADVGGAGLGRSELARRLMQATVEDNPDRQFFGDW